MKKHHYSTRHYLWIALVAVFLMAANVLLVKTVDDYGSPGFFALGIFIELVPFGVLVHSLIYGLAPEIKVIGSVLESGIQGMLTNPALRREPDSPPRLLRWMVERLTFRKATGFALTLAAFVSLTWLGAFIRVARYATTNSSLARIDLRIINLLPSIRTPFQTHAFIVITYLANATTMAGIVLATTLILWYQREKLAAFVVPVAATLAYGLGFIIKILAGRARPVMAYRLIPEADPSFPSGHAIIATVVFGLITYLVYRSLRSSLAKLILVLTYMSLVFVIGLSRVYLGVHFPSDVYGGILFGGFVLTLAVAVLEIARLYHLFGSSAQPKSNKVLLVAPIAAAIFSLLTANHFLHASPVVINRPHATISSLDPVDLKNVPLYSESLTGGRMEPMNFVYAGTKDQIISLFTSHGWYLAAPSTIANTTQAISVGFQGGQYLNAPVTPSYANALPEDLAFEKPTTTNSLRERHHTRLWQTGYYLPDGTPVWTATASLDMGIEFIGPAKIPTHRISPDVDAERAYIATSLGQPLDLVQLVSPQLGHNASGDPFFTDGKAELIRL